MRLFLAIPLSEEIRTNLAAVQERLRGAGAEVKWVEPENFHLTVAFLGDQDDSLRPDLENIGERLAEETPAFRIRAAGGSAFPKRGPAPLKTLWVGVAEGAEEWKALVRRAEPWLTPFGVPREGGLQPHITLGRVKGEKGMESLRAAVAAEARTDCGTQTAGHITLIQSFLAPTGATYKRLCAWAMRED